MLKKNLVLYWALIICSTSLFAIVSLFIITLSAENKADKMLEDVLKNMVEKKYISKYANSKCNVELLQFGNGNCEIKNIVLNNNASFETIKLENITSYKKLISFIRGSQNEIDLKLKAYNFRVNDDKLASNVELSLVGIKNDINLKFNLYNDESASLKGELSGSILKNEILENALNETLTDIREYLIFKNFNSNFQYKNDYLNNALYSLYTNKMNTIDSNQKYQFNYDFLLTMSSDIISKEKFKENLLVLVKYNIEDNKDLLELFENEQIHIENGLVKTLYDFVNLKENNKTVVITNNTNDNLLKLSESKDYKINIK